MSFLKFILVGAVNTILGFGTFFILVEFFDFHPQLANAFGYVLALIIAYYLNKLFVFSGAVPTRYVVFRFMLSFVIAFTINQSTLYILYDLCGANILLSQGFAMFAYTIIFYVLSKAFVFK